MNQVDKDNVTQTDAYGQIANGTAETGVTLRDGCGIHPKYRAIGKPISRCRTCRAIYKAMTR